MYDQKIQPPSPLELLFETRTILELGEFLLSSEPHDSIPRGDGHPVFVIPGFMVGDTTTWVMRRFLNELNYEVHPWNMGSNLGFYQQRLTRLVARVSEICEKADQPVSIIGWSLGGLYAREIAREIPEQVRQVITLGTPFARSLEASSIRPLYEWVSGNRAGDVDPDLFASIQKPPPVPTTAIYTRSDGIVAYQTTQEQEESATVQNIGVEGSHCGLGHNRDVLHVVADRLSQPRDAWQRYQRPQPAERAPSMAASLNAATHQLDQGLARLEALLNRKHEADHGSHLHR